MNDERLARRAAAGDDAAFEAIFRRYHQDLYRYCLATVGNPEDAQDALQNTMVKAMQALPGERREIKLKPWLYRVARNEAIEVLRRRRDAVELEAEQEGPSGEIAESAATRERLRQLLADLEELPERQRSALVMRELAGLDFEEIGGAFGTSPAVVRQTLYEARLSLRQMDEGREMSCETVMRALSDADGRVTRRRDLRAHLRGCRDCRAFRDGIAERRGEFAAISPLPVALSAGLLHTLTAAKAGTLGVAGAGSAAGAGAVSGGVAGTIGAGLGKTAAGATLVKSAATVAVVATVGISAAERGGVIDLPLGGSEGQTTKRAPASQTPAGGGDSAPAKGGAPAAEGTNPAAEENRNRNASTKGRGEGRQPPSSKAKGGGQKGKPAQGKPAGGASRATGRGAGAQGPPAAAGRGQGTAASRKPPQASPTPGAGATSKPSPKPNTASTPAGKGKALDPQPPPATEPAAPQTPQGSSGSKGSAQDQSLP